MHDDDTNNRDDTRKSSATSGLSRRDVIRAVVSIVDVQHQIRIAAQERPRGQGHCEQKTENPGTHSSSDRGWTTDRFGHPAVGRPFYRLPPLSAKEPTFAKC